MAKKDPSDEAKPDQPADNVDLTTHPLVEKQGDADDIKAPPDLVSLVGYIGPSKRPDSTRLYQDLTFRNYYEIPTSGIVSTSPINTDDENSPTHVQVKPDTKLDVVTVSVQSVEARFLSGSISSGFLGAAASSAQANIGFTVTCIPAANTAATVCTQVHCNQIANTLATTCTQHVQPAVAAQAVGAQGTMCTNITTYMPSCVAQADAQAAGGPCFLVMTTMTQCTFIGGQAQAGGAQLAANANIACTNITTHMPSCVAQAPIYLTTVPANLTDLGQHLHLFCQATIVTSGYVPRPTLCCGTTFADPRVVAQGIQQFAAQAPGGPQMCITLFTANPSNCGPGGPGGPFCLTVVTANPTDCGGGMCTNITTHMPSCVAQQPPICLTVVTANPTDCGQQCNPFCKATIVTSGIGPQPTLCNQTTLPDPRIAAGDVQQFGAQAAGAAPMCITVFTHAPTFCPPQCHPIANTAATLCTQNIQQTGPQTVICPTVFTAVPSGCQPKCHPIANTLATLCTQILHTSPQLCPPQCRPIANTAATRCTQIRTGPDPGAAQ